MASPASSNPANTPADTDKRAAINRVLWQACDTFRGIVDASEYKNYILVMLFLKYISDVWQEHYETLKSELGDDEARIRRKLDRERFVLPEGCRFVDLYEQRNAPNLGEVIRGVLDKIERANKQKLENVFRNVDYNSEANLGQTKDRNRRLKMLLEDFNNPVLDLRPSVLNDADVIGDAYEFLIERFASDAGKKAGEFYTPREVSRLIAELVKPQPGERIGDPACGSASLLVRCANHIRGKRKDSTFNDFAVYGQEINGSTWALAKMNMFLHNIDSAQLEWGDSLRNPKLLEDDALMRFEVVVANPPFSLDKWGADDADADPFGRFWRGIPPKSKGDFAFITHMIETTDRHKGRVGVVVPHGVLFRGSSEGKIRQKLIEDNLLDAVVGLPANLFYGTGIPAAILVFRQGKQDNTVMFIDASREYDDGKTQNRLRDDDIKKIVETYNARKNVDKYAYCATLAEVRDNDYNLNIPRYVDTFEEEAEIDLAAVQTEIAEIEQDLDHLKQQMQDHLQALGLEKHV